MRMLVAIVGMPGSGKSEAAAYFREKLGFVSLRFGDVVEKGVEESGKEVNEKNERWYREKIRRELGMKAVAVKLDPEIDELKRKEDKIVLDGLYSWEEYEFLKNKHPELVLVCVYARPETRYARLAKRPHRPLDSEEARSRDIGELVKLNKGGPIAIADFLVINEGKIEELYKKLNGVYEEIGGRKNDR